MKAHMNVLLGETLVEINQYLKEKGNKYENLLFTGHGNFNVSSIKLGNYVYSEKDMESPGFKDLIKGLGKYVKKDGTIILLACFQATPKYEEKNVKYNGIKIDVSLNGEVLTKKLSFLTGRNVLGAAGEVNINKAEFSGTYTQNYYAPVGNELHDLSKKFAGKWSISKPSGVIDRIGPIILNPDGSYKLAQLAPPQLSATADASSTTKPTSPAPPAPTGTN